jgi:hypothetical protein
MQIENLHIEVDLVNYQKRCHKSKFSTTNGGTSIEFVTQHRTGRYTPSPDTYEAQELAELNDLFESLDLNT